MSRVFSKSPDLENRALVSCALNEGPTCGPFNKFYSHSKLLLNADLENLPRKRDSTEYNKLFNDSQDKAKDLKQRILEVSNDKDSQFVGVMVANKSYQFNLKFFTYDEVSKIYDYPMPKSFGKIYSPTVELIVSFPYQVMLSQKHPE